MTEAVLTRRIFLNKIEIQALEQHIEYYRQKKRECDASGLLEDEYKYHNALSYLKGELAKYVLEQRYFKGLLSAYKKPKIVKKHRKDQPKPSIATDWKK